MNINGNKKDISEILSLIVPPSNDWFGCDILLTKAKPVAKARIKAIGADGIRDGGAAAGRSRRNGIWGLR